MSSASLIDTPAKPRSSRSVSVITVRDRVAGRVGSPVSAGTATWADIASLAPAAIAARNGTSSFASSVSTVAAHHRQLVMRVLVDGAQTREVLDRGGHPGRLQPADHRRAEPPDGRRVVAERPDAEAALPGSLARSRTGA